MRSVLPRIHANIDDDAADLTRHNYCLKKKGHKKAVHSPWLLEQQEVL